MKTPEELAEEYAMFGKSDVPDSVFKRQKIAEQKFHFLAGYQAAKNIYESKLQQMRLERPAFKKNEIEVLIGQANSDGYARGFKDGLVAQESWISVEDRLPETEEYLTIGYIEGTPWLHHCAVYSAKDGKWIRTDRQLPKDITSFVKYWMPLPAAPKEEA